MKTTLVYNNERVLHENGVVQSHSIGTELTYLGSAEDSDLAAANKQLVSIIEYNGRLFTPSYYGRLYEWNENGWVAYRSERPYSNSVIHTRSIIFDNQIWTGMTPKGSLYSSVGGSWQMKFNDPDLSIYDICEFGGYIYGTSGAKLYKWDSDTWNEICNIWYVTTSRLIVFGNELFATCSQKLYKFDGSNMSEVGNASQAISYLTVFKNKLYATRLTGELYEWNGTDGFVSKADTLVNGLRQMIVYQNKLYAVRGTKLIVWNEVDDWVEIDEALVPGGSTEELWGLGIFKDQLFVGSALGKLWTC